MNGVPRHLAVIMDGNGRWAQARHLPRVAGHRAGAKTLERLLAWCGETGVRYLTVYAFSTENWKRSAEEVASLMKLFALYLRTQEKRLVRERIRFRVIGRREDIPADLAGSVERLERLTASCDRLDLIVAFSYGGRAEITDAARRLARAARAGTVDPEKLTERDVAAHLYAPDVPDPDLMIRTSGELRLSNFLLWQLAYAEFFVTDVLWPDFDRATFVAALASYATRNRRLGGRP